MIKASEAREIAAMSTAEVDKFLLKVDAAIQKEARAGNYKIKVHFDTAQQPHTTSGEPHEPSAFTSKVMEKLNSCGYRVFTNSNLYDARGSGERLNSLYLDVQW